jgi:hypothetical protein
MLFNLALFSAIALAAVTGGVAGAEDLRPRPLPDSTAGLIFGRLKDGTLIGITQQPASPGSKDQVVAARYSHDNGASWSEPHKLLDVPKAPGEWSAGELLVDRDDELHVFFMVVGATGTKPPEGGEGERPLIGTLTGTRIDIGYARSSNGRKSWSTPRVLWIGYTGALNSVIQMESGRILLPFSYLTRRNWSNRGGGLAEYTFMGQYNSTVIYSDNGGATWHLGTDLMVPVPDIVSAYGAVEPVVVQLKDGRVWNLIRTQQGRFWESYSTDGAHWSTPQPTDIISSDSPAGLMRLSDGRIVLFWNHCLRYPNAYGGRQVLHAAISEDSGRTWRGCREVGRDPLRNEAPPSGGDYGTAYPFPVLANHDQVLFTSGQGRGRQLRMILDPRWLYETAQAADFSARAEEWTTFGTRGVAMVEHPTRPGAKLLQIRKTEADWPAAAVWNFPAGAQGHLRLRIQLRPGFAGALIGLTDHFSTPFDLEDRFNNVYNLWIEPGGKIEGTSLEPERWHDLQLDWSTEGQECPVRLDGKLIARLPVNRRSANVSYLRLRSTAGSTDAAGFLIESADVDVTPKKAAVVDRKRTKPTLSD